MKTTKDEGEGSRGRVEGESPRKENSTNTIGDKRPELHGRGKGRKTHNRLVWGGDSEQGRVSRGLSTLMMTKGFWR